MITIRDDATVTALCKFLEKVENGYGKYELDRKVLPRQTEEESYSRTKYDVYSTSGHKKTLSMSILIYYIYYSPFHVIRAIILEKDCVVEVTSASHQSNILESLRNITENRHRLKNIEVAAYLESL
jgi:hypothetical protein